MDKIKSDRERNEVDDLGGELLTVEGALCALGGMAENQHATELQKWVNDALGMIHVFRSELEERLEEYEER